MRKWKLKLFVAVIVMTAMPKAWAAWDDWEYGPKYWSPTEEVVTPHIRWAKPDAQGPLKVLFIVYVARMREVVELAERMDLQYTVFACGYQHQYCNDFCAKEPYAPSRTRDEEALINDLKAKLEAPYDVIVLGNVNWRSFPLIIQSLLLKKVKEGTPLVGFENNPDDFYTRATAKKEKLDLPALVPYKGLPAFSGQKDRSAWLDATVDYAVFGKGKILTMKGFAVPVLQMLTPGIRGANMLEPKFVEYDYYLAWIAHLLRFAAGRTAVRVAGNDYIAADRIDFTNLEYTVSGQDGKAVTCAFTLRNDDNQVVGSQEKRIKLSAGGTAVRFDVPRMPAGRYFGDVWVKEGKKIWAFGSSFVELSGNPVIESLEIKKDYGKEEKVTGKINVRAQKTSADNLVLVLRQRDTYGRVTAQSRVNVPVVPTNAAQAAVFELSGSQPQTIVQYLKAELWQGNDLLDCKTRAFSISNLPPKDDIRFIAWAAGDSLSYLGYHMFSELAKAGFDTQYGPQPGMFSEIPFLYNIRHIPFATCLIDRKSSTYPQPGVLPRTKDDHVRLPCLTDPGYRKQLADDLTGVAKRAGPFSTTEFSMGDEDNFSGPFNAYELCFSPTCVAAFHKFLASEYQTMEAMNREYGTQYKSFDEVQPVTLDEVKKKNELQPLWVDFRRHMENTWAGIFPYCAEVIRKVVPKAKIGHEGGAMRIDSNGAADHYKLGKVIGINAFYDIGFTPHAVMSFAQPGAILGLGWQGGYAGSLYPEFQRYTAWRNLFRGANSYWVWTVCAYEIGSVMAPDLSIYDFYKANIAEVREIKSGIGKLLMTAERADDGIAILYSASSVHVSSLTEGLPRMDKVLNALTPLFEDTGHQFRIISSEQLANGDLEKGGYRLLWLPYAQALSRKEAAEAEAFVREGGTIIADLRPGVRDEHGKPYEGGGVLDNVFGVKQRTESPMATNCTVEIKLNEWLKTMKGVACDWSVGLGTGAAKALLGGTKPALIISRFGKGKAILLNFSLSAYFDVNGALEDFMTGGLDRSAVKGDESGNIRDLFRALMAEAGIDEPMKVAPQIAGMRLHRFRRESIEYIGVLQRLPNPKALSEAYLQGLYKSSGNAKPLTARPGILKLSAKRHVYDTRLGKYLGYTDRIKTSIEPGKGMLFALLPYEVQNVKLTAPRRIKQGEVLEYEAAVQGEEHPGLHVFHVEFMSPKGEPVSYYADNAVGENGKCKGAIPLAVNEAVGGWKLRVRDVATGTTAEQVFTVEERK